MIPLDGLEHLASSSRWALRRVLDDNDDGVGKVTTASFIGIIVAISGNVISLALNCQKLAHKRLERERERQRGENRQRDSKRRSGHARSRTASEVIPEEAEPLRTSANGHLDDTDDGDDERTRVGESSQQQTPSSDAESEADDAWDASYTPTRTRRPTPDFARSILLDTEPLLLVAQGSPQGSLRTGYGSGLGAPGAGVPRPRDNKNLFKRLFPRAKGTVVDGIDVEGGAAIAVDVHRADTNGVSKPSPDESSGDDKNIGNESDYLKSKLW